MLLPFPFLLHSSFLLPFTFTHKLEEISRLILFGERREKTRVDRDKRECRERVLPVRNGAETSVSFSLPFPTLDAQSGRSLCAVCAGTWNFGNGVLYHYWDSERRLLDVLEHRFEWISSSSSTLHHDVDALSRLEHRFGQLWDGVEVPEKEWYNHSLFEI